MDARILFPEIELFSNSDIRSDPSSRSKRKMPFNLENGFPPSIQMVKSISKSKRKKLRLMELKKSVLIPELIRDGVCNTICENDDGFVAESSPPAIVVEKSTPLANNSSSVLNTSVSPVVPVAISPVPLAVSQPCIPLLNYNLRPRRKCC